MQTLNKLYHSGIIPYPRTENDYIEKDLFSFFPHPKLPEINAYMTPLKKMEYDYNFNMFFLELHNLRILTPSLYTNYNQHFKKTLDKDGKIKKEVQSDIDNNIQIYKKHCDDIDKDLSYPLDYELNYYKQDYNIKKIKIENYKNIDTALEAIVEQSPTKHEKNVYTKPKI